MITESEIYYQNRKISILIIEIITVSILQISFILYLIYKF